jgi:tRNA A-37 threonylcarbamoyl transferase component Bud32
MNKRARACRQRAIDCERAVSKVNDAEVQAAYWEMARRWREITERVEDVEQRLRDWQPLPRPE